MKKSPTCFNIYSVTLKQVGDLRYCLKATKFEKISHVFWHLFSNFKTSGWFFSQFCGLFRKLEFYGQNLEFFKMFSRDKISSNRTFVYHFFKVEKKLKDPVWALISQPKLYIPSTLNNKLMLWHNIFFVTLIKRKLF